MIPVLILIRPLDLYTGQRVDIRLGSAADAAALGMDGKPWEPAIARRPRIAQDLMSADLDGKFKLAAADFVISMNLLSRIRDVNRLHFPGASVIIYRATDLAMSRSPVEFKGIVRTAPYDRDTQRLTINAQVDRSRIDKPLLTREFTGGGGADGEAAVRGVLKPFGAGYNESIEWVLFDTVNNIGMLDGYGNLRTVHRALEALNDLGPPVRDYPTYAALAAGLRAKEVVPGRWATCIAEGMVGLGAPPVGRITFVASFALNRSGAIMKQALSVQLGLPDTDIDLDAFDLLDVSMNREVRYHTTSQIQVSDLIEALAWPINATPLITAQNQIAITRATLSAPVATLIRGGSNPTVTDWRTAEPIEPVYRIVYRACRPGVVLSNEEVNYVDDLIDRGLYSPTEVYRAGNLVWLADKSQWLYRNATPAAGHMPPSTKAPDAAGNVSDEWWFRRQRASTAVDLAYASGETLESLKPRQAGADVTGENTAHDTAFVGGIPTQEVLDTIEAVVSDGILSPPEKSVAIVQFDDQKAKMKALNDRFIALGSPADIAPYRDAAVTAFNKLDTYLHVTLVPSIDAVSSDTPIDGAVYRQTWREAVGAINEYLAAITGRPGKDAPLVLTQWSIDGVSNWHANFFGADAYYRQSNDGGVTYGPAVKGVGEDGFVGADGLSATHVFRRSPTVPATPLRDSGNPPPGWSDGPPAGTDFLWMSKATYRLTAQVADWSAPQRISGEPGLNAPLIKTQWSINGVDGWHDNYFGADKFYRQSNDGGATYGPAIQGVGEGGAGADGTNESIIFKRSETVPPTPPTNVGDPPPGWSDGPPDGEAFLWLSKARFRAGVQLVPWSTPQRISGPEGKKGDNSTVPGPPGRPAVVFYQDAVPVGPIEGDTWVTMTVPKTWRQYRGGVWSPMLGAVAGFDLLTAKQIAVDDLASLTANIGFLVSYNGQGGRVERDGNGTRVYSNSGRLRSKSGF